MKEDAMAKHLLIWRMRNSRIPVDPKERGSAWGALIAMVENDMESGAIKDWGAFPGEGKGYCTFEGTNLELMKVTQQYSPFVDFKTHSVASVLEVKDLITGLSG
jgi:hypothetical protein